MDILFEYRNPLFGVVILFSIISLISFTNYWLLVYKKKQEQNRLTNLIDSFDFYTENIDYSVLLDNYKVPFEILELIANTYYKNGDYEKAINLYLKLLDVIYDRDKKETILKSLGVTYFRAGFMQRSKDIFIRTIELYPHNAKALNYLLIIYEKLNDYQKALEVLDTLDELDLSTQQLKSYLNVMSIINDSVLSIDKRCSLLVGLISENDLLNRIIIDFIKKVNKTLFFELIEKYYTSNMIDLVWFYYDKKDNEICNNKIKEILVAKGNIVDDTIVSETFELQILIDLKKTNNKNTTLSFEYICKECKHIYPLHQNRCPNCFSILSLCVEPIISKKVDIEKSESLL